MTVTVMYETVTKVTVSIKDRSGLFCSNCNTFYSSGNVVIDRSVVHFFPRVCEIYIRKRVCTATSDYDITVTGNMSVIHTYNDYSNNYTDCVINLIKTDLFLKILGVPATACEH